MSHSTHVGFSEPPTCVHRFSPPSLPEFPGPPIPSACVGVAHTARPSRPFTGTFGLYWPSLWSRPVGVGQRRLTSDASVPVIPIAKPLCSESMTRGVGHDPDPVSEVRGTDGGCRNAVPPRVIPEGGQGPENVSHPARVCCELIQRPTT